ncbi:site-2 protease family protein [Neisseria sp. ZJ106]|uniref:Site-2 protease family protein n=1 Tax=Neisseria lisongii TaxID=2912188 RepID=A0ABY7RKB1_9NEIS|nr:site-2 protease family protein [Neisseria lisongii]MCF7521187.1 site-2 protease family protein [Neisseria lisongii]WCL71681.1 site-2 protease family protein [Neisseria lisongii]
MFQKFDLGIFLLAVLPVLLALVGREVAKGYMARHWGDPTAEQHGFLTFNPLPHIDIVGTIIVPLFTFMLTPFMFGWCKPIPIDSRNFRNTRLAWRWVAASGPLANLAMAFFWGLILVLVPHAPTDFQYPLGEMAKYGVQINAVLTALSLLPILPWDGGIIIDSFLPAHLSQQYRKIEPYGTLIVILLLISGLLGSIIQPLYTLIVGLVSLLVSLLGG